MTVKMIETSIRKLYETLQAFQALHGMAKPVKGNEQGAMALMPFALSGKARVTLNENVAALMAITKPHDDAVEVMRKQYRDRLENETKTLVSMHPDEDERGDAEAKLNAKLDRDLNREVETMLDRVKKVELEPLQRVSLNETTNAFFPTAFALLLNDGLIEGAKRPEEEAA